MAPGVQKLFSAKRENPRCEELRARLLAFRALKKDGGEFLGNAGTVPPCLLFGESFALAVTFAHQVRSCDGRYLHVWTTSTPSQHSRTPGSEPSTAAR